MKAHLRLLFAGGAMLVLLLALVACSGGGQRAHFPTGQMVTATVPAGQQTVVALPSGSSATFPAGAFAANTHVTVSEMLGGEERDAATFPQGSGLLLGALSITAAPGAAVHQDLTVVLVLEKACTPGEQFVVFQFNPAHHVWESAGSAVAQVGADGQMATFTANTTGLTELEVSYGVFENLHP